MDGLRRYTDLSERCFFADDKKIVCEYIETSNISIRRFAKDHKLNYARIANWMLKWRCLKDTGKDTFYEDGSGRPPKLDSASSIALCSYLRDCRQAQNAPTMAQVRTKIASEVKATAQRRGIATEDGRIDRKTELNILKAHNCEEGKCQFKTRARIINEADYKRHREAHRAALEARRIHREITAADRQAAKAAREVEKRRRSLLTDEDKRQESNAKRQATIARNREERARQQLLRIGNGNSNDGNSQISDSHDGTRNQLTEIFEGNSDDSNDGYLSLEDEVPL